MNQTWASGPAHKMEMACAFLLKWHGSRASGGPPVKPNWARRSLHDVARGFPMWTFRGREQTAPLSLNRPLVVCDERRRFSHIRRRLDGSRSAPEFPGLRGRTWLRFGLLGRASHRSRSSCRSRRARSRQRTGRYRQQWNSWSVPARRGLIHPDRNAPLERCDRPVGRFLTRHRPISQIPCHPTPD